MYTVLVGQEKDVVAVCVLFLGSATDNNAQSVSFFKLQVRARNGLRDPELVIPFA